MAKPLIPSNDSVLLQREGLTEIPAVWEDGIRADAGPGSFEWWYFDAHLEDGSAVVVVFMTKPLLQRRDPLTPAVTITITRPDGQKLSEFPLYPPAQFSASKDQCDVHIGPSWVRGDLHCYELHAEGKGLAVDLAFTGIAPPWRPGTGKNYYDKSLSRYFAWLPAIPYGTVEGTLTYDNQVHPVRGDGYHDHNWGNIGLEQVMSHWYWGRAHLGTFSLIFVEMTSTATYKGQKLPVFMLADEDHLLTGDGLPLKLEIGEIQKHPSGRNYPNRLDFHWQAGQDTVHIALCRPQIIEATSLLGFMPLWKQKLIRLVRNPYYFRFQADMELKIDFQGLKRFESGQALYELMLLR
jgi:hypothetical protein